MTKRYPENPAEAGAWPEPVDTDNFEHPVEVLITLEKREYDWLRDFVSSEEGNTSFTSSFQRAIELLIQAARQDIEWDFVSDIFAKR